MKQKPVPHLIDGFTTDGRSWRVVCPPRMRVDLALAAGIAVGWDYEHRCSTRRLVITPLARRDYYFAALEEREARKAAR